MDGINFQDSIFTVLARLLIQFFVFLVFSLLFWILWFKFKGYKGCVFVLVMKIKLNSFLKWF